MIERHEMHNRDIRMSVYIRSIDITQRKKMIKAVSKRIDEIESDIRDIDLSKYMSEEKKEKIKNIKNDLLKTNRAWLKYLSL